MSIENIESKSAEDIQKIKNDYYLRKSKYSDGFDEQHTPLIFRENKDIRVTAYKETKIGMQERNQSPIKETAITVPSKFALDWGLTTFDNDKETR